MRLVGFLGAALLVACGGDDDRRPPADAGVLDGAVTDGASGTDGAVSDGGTGADATISDGSTGDGSVPPIVGEADPTFGRGGLVTHAVGPATAVMWAVRVQSDGKLIGLGRNYEAIFAARLTADGALDPSFGTGGIAWAPFGRPQNGFQFGTADFAIDGSGGLVVASYVNPLGALFEREVLLRFASDGTIDTAFGTEGHVLPDPAPLVSMMRGVALEPDGDIVTAGTDGNLRLQRFHADGTLDTTFGTAGVVRTPLGASAAEAWTVAIQPDAKIVAAGTRCCPNTVALARFTPAGALDPTFGGGTGVALDTLAAGDRSQAYQTAFEPDGDIAVAALRGQSSGSGTSFAVGRFTAAGALDTTFGTSGWSTDTGTIGGAFGIARQTDGKLVAVGQGRWSGTSADIARFTDTGVLDPAFGTGGLAEPAPGTAGVALDAAGRIVTVGGQGFRRHLADGTLDTSFGVGGARTIPANQSVDRGLAVAVQPDGKILVGGAGGVIGPSTVIRLLPDGALDASFGMDGVVRNVPEILVVTSLSLDSVGRIVVGGLSLARADGLRVARLAPDGTPDASFGSMGAAGGGFSSGAAAQSWSGTVGVADTVIAAGFGVTGSAIELGVLRFDEDGAPDASFGTGGAAVVPVPGTAAGATSSVLVQTAPTGEVIVAGAANAGGTLARFDDVGVLDTSFGTSGAVTPAGVPLGMALGSDGSIVLATVGRDPPTMLTLTRYDASGAVDASFGTGGSIRETLGSTDYLLANGPTPIGVAVADDGSILLGAASGSDGIYETAVLFRYTPAGARDASFGDGGQLTLPLSVASSAIHAIALSGAQPVLAGRAWTPEGGSDYAVLRLR